MAGEISLCVNTDILEEYEEKLCEYSSAEIAHNVVEAIATLTTTTMQNSYVHFRLLPNDADDNKFVDCAIAGNATFVVSNDSHFDVLKEIDFPKLILKSLQEFAAMLD